MTSTSPGSWRVVASGCRRGRHSTPRRVWDASAVVTVIINDVEAAPPIGADARSPRVVRWGPANEVASAIARLERAGTSSGEQVMRWLDLLQELSTVWLEVLPSDSL